MAISLPPPPILPKNHKIKNYNLHIATLKMSELKHLFTSGLLSKNLGCNFGNLSLVEIGVKPVVMVVMSGAGSANVRGREFSSFSDLNFNFIKS